MKFNPTWQQVALLAVMLGAIIAAHLMAPPVVGAITGIVSTIVGSLFVNLQPAVGAVPVQPAQPTNVIQMPNRKENES